MEDDVIQNALSFDSPEDVVWKLDRLQEALCD
jgi:hypothetical protein